MGSRLLEKTNFFRRSRVSEHFDRIRRTPDIELPESGLKPLFELDEEFARAGLVDYIDKHAH
jgi:hypothetical protein